MQISGKARSTMQRIAFLLLLIMLMACPAISQIPRSLDNSPEAIVKSQVYTVKIDLLPADGGRVKRMLVDYDEGGRITRECGRVIGLCVLNSYDAAGRLIKKITVDQSVIDTMHYRYDAQGNLAMTVHGIRLSRMRDTVIFENQYDNSGLLTGIVERRLNRGSVPDRIVNVRCRYDEERNKVREFRCEVGGICDSLTWEYDAAGRLIHRTRKYGGQVLLDESRSYDVQGRVVELRRLERTVYWTKTVVRNFRREIAYDEEGRIQVERVTDDERPKPVTFRYYYLENGMISGITGKNGQGAVVEKWRFKYQR